MARAWRLRPAKVDAGELVEPQVEGSIEVPEAFERSWPDVRVVAPLGLAETVRRGATLRLHQAREPLGRVEVEVLLSHHQLQSQELLHNTGTISLDQAANSFPIYWYTNFNFQSSEIITDNHIQSILLESVYV